MCKQRSVLWSDGSECVSVCQDIRAVWNGTIFLVFLMFAAFGLSAGLWRYYMFYLHVEYNCLSCEDGGLSFFIYTHGTVRLKVQLYMFAAVAEETKTSHLNSFCVTIFFF